MSEQISKWFQFFSPCVKSDGAVLAELVQDFLLDPQYGWRTLQSFYTLPGGSSSDEHVWKFPHFVDMEQLVVEGAVNSTVFVEESVPCCWHRNQEYNFKWKASLYAFEAVEQCKKYGTGGINSVNWLWVENQFRPIVMHLKTQRTQCLFRSLCNSSLNWFSFISMYSYTNKQVCLEDRWPDPERDSSPFHLNIGLA